LAEKQSKEKEIQRKLNILNFQFDNEIILPISNFIEWHSPTRKMGKYRPSIDRVLHIAQFNKQLDLPLDD